MTYQNKIKGSISALLLASSMMSAAYAGDVACPDVATVKDSYRALNAVVRQSKKTFFVLSAQPAFSSSELGWIVLAQASAGGFDAAFDSGQNDVKSVAFAATEEPIEQQGVYLCAYFTEAGGMNVMTVAPQKQDDNINPMSLKLDHLKFKK